MIWVKNSVKNCKIRRAKCALILFFFMTTTQIINPASPRYGVVTSKKQTITLSDIEWTGAGVMPTFKDGNTMYCILTCESRGPRKGKYTDFGGSRDSEHLITAYYPGNTKQEQFLFSDKRVGDTAAREFWEEGILDMTLGWSLDQTYDYINQKNSHTSFIIVNYCVEAITNKNRGIVSYITDFTPYKDTFIKNFFGARKHAIENQRNDQEDKNAIALVRWDLLQKTVINSKVGHDITIRADKVYTAHGVSNNVTITLDDTFVMPYRAFFQEKIVAHGQKPQIRFYILESLQEEQ